VNPASEGRWEVPRALARSNYVRALEIFKVYDSNRDGKLDVAEFRKLMQAMNPGCVDGGKSDALFREVDIDRLGAISFPRFLCWLFCDNGRLAADLEEDEEDEELGRPTSVEGPASQRSLAIPGRRASAPGGLVAQNSVQRSPSHTSIPQLPAIPSPISRTPSTVGAFPRSEPIVLRIVYEPSMGLQMGKVVRALKPVSNVVKILARRKSTAKGCDSVTAMIGRGIHMWERDSMAMHFDDPFRDMRASMQWCEEMMNLHVRMLLETRSLCGRGPAQ